MACFKDLTRCEYSENRPSPGWIERGAVREDDVDAFLPPVLRRTKTTYKIQPLIFSYFSNHSDDATNCRNAP
jgi:hypothetical protein